MESTTHTMCPSCGAKGRKVGVSTLSARLRPEVKTRITAGPFRFCRSEGCDIVYFDEAGDATFGTADLTVLVFQKSADLNRRVCYCFDHTVRSIQEEVAAQGASEVAESIRKKCKSGLDDCEHNNPQGTCCLGNVRQVVKAAIEAIGGDGTQQDTSSACCSNCKE